MLIDPDKRLPEVLQATILGIPACAAAVTVSSRAISSNEAGTVMTILRFKRVIRVKVQACLMWRDSAVASTGDIFSSTAMPRKQNAVRSTPE